MIIKVARHVCLVCVLTLLGAPLLCAKDLAAYRVGDNAEADILAPSALDVVDPAATAALKSAEAMKTPDIFLFCSDVTNALAGEFLGRFVAARSNFTAAVQDTFHQATLDNATIASPDFGYFITAFNIKNKNFPVTANLAATWARGHPGLGEQKRLLDFLQLTMQHAVRPDDLPENFSIGEIIRLAPVASTNENLTLIDAEARGKLVTEASIIPISQLRTIFRREFTADDEQPLARALTMLLKPNCIPDPDLTRQARDQAVRQIVVSDHYDAGQIIVRQGAVIDAKIKLAQNDAPSKPDQIVPVQNQALVIRARNSLLVVSLAAISFVALLRFWQLAPRWRAPLMPVSAVSLTTQNPAMLHAELAQMLKETLVQELAVQRRELLVMQQIAAAEITGLVQRLDELQMTMQERKQAYEMQIQKLEKELAARTEENHELLKLKIEMIQQQLEAEQTRSRMDFN
jgi:hypothetical protein